jgi:hypothetical protein
MQHEHKFPTPKRGVIPKLHDGAHNDPKFPLAKCNALAKAAWRTAAWSETPMSVRSVNAESHDSTQNDRGVSRRSAFAGPGRWRIAFQDPLGKDCARRAVGTLPAILAATLAPRHAIRFRHAAMACPLHVISMLHVSVTCKIGMPHSSMTCHVTYRWHAACHCGL